ncbi:hypothetical protein C0J52_11450 [Blattella germanica]|nr:hypothetical protein C0J52_11450 [Blattella germanica]
MATFRSGVKILSQVSKRQGYRSFQLRSYSDDRRTTFHRSRSPFWTTNNSKTPLQTSKSWFSLFHRKKSPENKLLTHESGCDLKETCQSESTKNESWLSFLKKKVSKDNRPPLTCCRMHQARLRKEEEQKALQEGREPEGWKSDVEIVTKESNAPVMCKTPTEPQPQPPPQPPPPRAVEVLKENVEKLSSKTDMAISSKSFNTRQPYEEFKIPIQSAPPPPVSGENLQPRKQSPYTTGDKFREGTNFQQCKKFHKQSNLETGSLTKIKSKHLHKSTIAQRKGKTTGVLKPAKVLNNKTLNILHTSSLLKEVKTSSKIIIPTKIQNTNSPQVLVNEIKAIKPTNISNKTLAPNKDHDSSKNLASEPPLQNVPNTATSGQVIHLDVINEKNKTQLQSDLLEVKLKLDNEVIQSTVCTRTKERKPTTKLSSKITQRRNNLKISTIRQAVNKDNCMHSNIKNKEVNSGIKDNPTLTNKYLNLGLNRSGERSTQKSVPSSIKSSCSSSKKDNKCTQEFSPSKNETRSIKSSTNINNITNNTASSKITSSHSLPNINKNSKHNEERTSLKKAGRSIKTSSTPNNKPKPVEKLSKTNIKSETSTKVKTKEGCEQIKTDNTKSIRPNDESFISAWKENYSYVSFPRKARIPKKKENLKLTQKGNEDVYQLSLPSNIQPFVRLGEGVHLWSTPDPVQVQSPHNQKQTIKSVRKAPKLPTEEKEPWFTECQTNYVDTDFPEKRYSISKSGTNMRKSNNGLIGNKFTQDEYPKPSYAKILKYGNRNVLNSKLNNKAKSQKEKFLSSYFSFGVVNDDLNPKVKRKDEDVKQGRFVESKLVGTNYRKDQHIKQKSHSEITNYLKDTKEIKSHKQDEISIDDSVYISDMSVPIPCQSQMEESSMNDQYGSLLYAKDNFGDDFNSAKTRDKSNYYRQPYEHDKNMDASLSNIHCKNLMTDSSIQPPHSNHRNLTNDSLPDMKSPNVTEKHIPFSYEKSYGHWSILESDPTDEQQVDPHIENVIVTLPKPCSSGACLTNSRQFPNKMVKQTFSSYVGSSSCNQSCMSHNQEMEQLVHKHIKKSKYNMLANPEMSFKKNKQYIKNKRQKITGDNVKYYDCVNAETLKLKNGLSKTPMSYTKQNVIVQQFLPNRRYYSSYTSNKTSSLCKVLNRIITQNNEYLKYTGKNLLSTVPSKTIQRSPKHARKNQNTSSQAAANHAPKYFSKGQGNYSLLQKIHSDSEIHTLRRNDFNNKQAKQFTTENPVKQNPPLPSFAEYIEDPKTETKNIGNEEKVKNKFLESKNVKTLNINNTKNQQIQLSSPRENHKEKKQKTEEDLIQGNFSNDKEDKLGMLTFTKLPIKCSATQYLIGQQDQLMHSQSSFKLNSLQPPTIQYNNAPQYARHASSYSYIKPFNYGNKSKMLCSSSKDSKSEPPSCGKVDSGVKKEKSKKSCNKVTAPGCKAPKSVDCVIIKELPPCKKVCAPKKSYSECIREQTPPRPFTECLIRKPDICPGQKPVEKSYDGCAKKKKEIECPEPVIEKPIKPKKKVRDVCDPKEECDDVEPFKFKSGYSRPPMKCSSKNPSMSQPNLPPVRSYSNLKTVLPEKPKIPTRSSSYINFQIKNLKEREYSSTEKTVPESKLFEFEAKSSTRDPEPAQTFRRSSIRSYETSMSPDKISLKKDDQIVGSLKQSSLKIQSTHGNILKRKKEVKPQTNPLVLREDQYVKISLRHPETSPQKKKTISDTPFNLSTEPCLGQKHEKVLRKTSAVYPGYSALSITKNKRDKEKKFTKNPTDTSTFTASTSMIRHEALQSSKIICETARNKEGTKENDENISSNLSNPSEELADLSNKTDYIVTTNRDGNVEDLFTTIKSWFSFLKTKEGLPQSDNKITENQIVVSPCETNHVNELPSESLLENTRERQCGSDISNSLQSGKTGYECKDFSSPEPFISEYAKSHSLAECYPENLANEADATFIKPSACEMYFTKNKKVAKTKLHTSSMRTNHQENIILEGGRKSMLPTKLAKHQNSKIVTPEKLRMSHERSELPTSAETYPSNGKINIFSELLNKKSTLQEWQEEYPKHINPQFDMKTHSKLNEAINKFTKVNNHVQDKIQAAYEDKVFSSGNTTETLNQESISGPLKIDKEIVVMKQNEKIQELESDKPTFFHNDNLQLSKMSNSISPSNKELGCTIKDKNASPHPFVKIRPNNCSIHSREVTFKVKGINHTRAKKVIKAHNRLSKRKNKHIPFKQAKSNRHQSENSANTDTPKYSFDAYKEINIKTKESPATSNSYVALINKFPDIMGRNIGNNSFSDIWSCHQKELPVNFILKVQDPIYPKANPKLDLKVLKPVSHDVEAECKEIEDHQSQSSNKVSQRKNMAKECSSVKTNPGSNTVKYVLPCLGLHNRPCKILLNTFNLFPLCSCYDKYKQFLMVPSLVHISPRHKSMIPKRGSDELCTEKSDAKNNSSGSGTPNETCKKNNKLGYVECEEPPKKEKPTCEKETRPKDVCPPIKRPIKMPCEKKETKKDVVKIEVNIEKEVKYEVKQEKKEPLTKEEIEARKKSFQVTKISPIKDPPPLPSCDSIAAKEVSIEILKPPNGEKPPPKSCEEESSSDICSKQCNGEGSPTVTNPPSNPCNDGGGGGKTS